MAIVGAIRELNGALQGILEAGEDLHLGGAAGGKTIHQPAHVQLGNIPCLLGGDAGVHQGDHERHLVPLANAAGRPAAG